MKHLIATEYQECKSYWEWAQYHPLLKEFLIKHCNENKSGSWFVKALKAIGMRPGLLDYQYPIPNVKYLGLWIEMKRSDEINKKKRENQGEWIEKLNKVGHYATYAYGCDHAIAITTNYLENRI